MYHGDSLAKPKIPREDESLKLAEEDTNSQKLLEELEKCQNEITVLNDQSDKEKNDVSKKFDSLKKPHFNKRNDVIERIPRFWITVFDSHPQLSTLIDEEVSDCLQYMTKMDIEYVENVELSYNIHFFFRENPYIENEVLTKEILLDDADNSKSNSTHIRWKNCNLCRSNSSSANTLRGRKRALKEETFFNWFCNNDGPLVDIFADIIKDEAWQNPLPFYLAAAKDEMVNKDMVEDEDLDDIEDTEEGLSDDDELVGNEDDD